MLSRRGPETPAALYVLTSQPRLSRLDRHRWVNTPTADHRTRMTNRTAAPAAFDEDIADSIAPLPTAAELEAADLVRVLTDSESYALVRDINNANIGSRARAKARPAIDFALRRRYPDGDTAATLIALWDAGDLSISAVTVGADKDGIYEDRDGSCLRGYDPDTTRQLIGLTFSTRGWIDADGTRWKAPR